MMRHHHGTNLAEATAAIVLFLPLFMLMIVVTASVSTACLLQNALSASAHRAARSLALACLDNPDVENNRSQQEALVFDQIRIPGIIVDSRQFEASFDNQSQTQSVTVTVSYSPGQYGLYSGPNTFALTPLPLNLKASATHRLR